VAQHAHRLVAPREPELAADSTRFCRIGRKLCRPATRLGRRTSLRSRLSQKDDREREPGFFQG
jgi:hypothetical protein